MTPNNQIYYSNGKLLLTGEYLVLAGALALAIPTKQGQSLEIKATEDVSFNWESKVLNESMLKLNSITGEYADIASNKPEYASYLLNVLKAAQELSPDFNLRSVSAYAQINFNTAWGLGSSSSLISNVADWAGVDPFELHFKVSDGSGYDVACAKAKRPVLYMVVGKSPTYTEIDFNPYFKDQLYFVYLGAKQDSAGEVAKFRKKTPNASDIQSMNELTNEIATSVDLNSFNYLIREHERLMSGILGMKTLKSDRFSHFDGEMKSLGAWGGDFALVTFKHGRQALQKEIEKKGLTTLFAYEEMSLY